MAKMVDASTLWKCETCFHHKNEGCSPEIWCENGEAYRPDCNKLVFVEAEPVKHGKWTQTYASWSQDYDKSKNIRYRCSECKGIAMWDTEYCPNCGSKMDGE